jgi:RNA polymerase sigma-70 factor (ECF subfamily)
MDRNTQQPRGEGVFPTTRWSLVGRAARRAEGGATPTPESERAALGELIRIYLPALRAHLIRHLRIDPHRSDDLLQGFLTEKVLDQHMIELADPKRGKFRTFLLAALQRFVIDELRCESAKKRAPGSKMMDIELAMERVSTGQNPSDAFDRAWAGEVLGEVMRRMHQECESDGRTHLWDIFEARMLLPITDGAATPSHEDLARRHRLESATQSANALGSAKRLFTRIFRSVVSEYAADESEVEDEIRDLWEIFSRSPA